MNVTCEVRGLIPEVRCVICAVGRLMVGEDKMTKNKCKKKCRNFQKKKKQSQAN